MKLSKVALLPIMIPYALWCVFWLVVAFSFEEFACWLQRKATKFRIWMDK